MLLQVVEQSYGKQCDAEVWICRLQAHVEGKASELECRDKSLRALQMVRERGDGCRMRHCELLEPCSVCIASPSGNTCLQDRLSLKL